MNSIPGDLRFRRGEQVSADKLTRVADLAARSSGVSVDGMTVEYGDGTFAMVNSSVRGFFARLTLNHADGTYSWVEVQWDGSAYVTLENGGFGGYDGSGAGLAREANLNDTILADPAIGTVVWLEMADSGDAWEFDLPKNSGLPPHEAGNDLAFMFCFGDDGEDGDSSYWSICPGSLPGPQGIQGNTGATGPVGPAGLPGASVFGILGDESVDVDPLWFHLYGNADRYTYGVVTPLQQNFGGDKTFYGAIIAGSGATLAVPLGSLLIDDIVNNATYSIQFGALHGQLGYIGCTTDGTTYFEHLLSEGVSTYLTADSGGAGGAKRAIFEISVDSAAGADWPILRLNFGGVAGSTRDGASGTDTVGNTYTGGVNTTVGDYQFSGSGAPAPAAGVTGSVYFDIADPNNVSLYYKS